MNDTVPQRTLGTSGRLEENLGAAALALTPADLHDIERRAFEEI